MIQKFEIRPGMWKDETELAAEPIWHDGDWVRWRLGRPEKIGGNTAFATGTVSGTARTAFAFQDNTGNKRIAIGTNTRLYLLDGDQNPTLYDITPYRATGTATNNPFDTTASSSTLSVTISGHGVSSGDFVLFSGVSDVGGVTVSGEYTVQSVTDSDTFTITDDETASTTTSGGGTAVNYYFHISPGNANSSTSSGSDWTQDARVWSLDNWGEDLIASIHHDKVYRWDVTKGVSAVATQVTGAGQRVHGGIHVSQQDRILVTVGQNPTTATADDPYSVVWSDREDLNTWTASAANAAGDVPFGGAGVLVTSRRFRNESLVFAANGLYSMEPTDESHFIFRFDLLGEGQGPVGPNAAVIHQDIAFWMSKHQFYMYDGVIKPIPNNTVLQYVFDDINRDQLVKVFAFVQPKFNEIWWCYPSKSSTEVDRYVIFNYAERQEEDSKAGIWYTGTIDRLCWVPEGIYNNPIAIDSSGNIWEHESGYDDGASGYSSYVETGDIDIEDGGEVMLISAALLDFTVTGDIQLTVKTKRYPNASDVTKGPYTASDSTQRLNLRARGRQMAFRISSSGVGSDWRLGTIAFDILKDGER